MNVPDKFNGKNVYLSFVNDLQDSPKDQELLRDLFHNDESMNHLINEMIKNSQGYYGIELDFEGFWKDKELTQKYMLFTYRLYYQCIKHDLKLRIVLEPSFTEQDYMKGPEYVVMCYNLYGKHSTPGPKANYEFIDKLVEKAKILPKVSFAIANGGCVWTVSGGAKYLTYNEIQKLKPKDVFRDSSDALIGRIDDGVTYYADDTTIKKWKRYLNDKGYDVAIWRLGGNR
jgi:spore germination protein YaaH